MSDPFWPGDDRAGALFTGPALLAAMVRVEAAWLAALVSAGIAGAGAADDLSGLVGDDDVATVAAGAESGGNPVIPLLSLLRERLCGRNADAAAWLHLGLTSQDVLDTALMLCVGEVIDRLRRELDSQVGALVALAGAHRATPMVGRTLTQHAVPITFGLKVANWLNGVLDAAEEVDAIELPAQFGGAAGTLAATTVLAGQPAPAGARAGGAAPDGAGPGGAGPDGAGPDGAGPGGAAAPDGGAGPGGAPHDAPARAMALAGDAARSLGLRARTPWQTTRAPVTRIGDALARCTDAFGHIAGDVLVLTRPEIGELAEPAGPGRGGSSTMPNKANPVLSVLVRRAALAAPQSAAQLHLASAESRDERADGAWHLEWAALRTLCRTTVVAATQTTELVTGLRVRPDRMLATLRAAGADVLAERRALPRRAAPDTGQEADPAGYLGATDVIIDAILDRARTRTEKP